MSLDLSNGGGGSGVSQATLDAAIAALINSAPGALDTLDELAAAFGDDANFAATMTTALATKQASDADLTAIAALVSAANKFPYATGSGTWTLGDITAAGRALIDDADAAAQLATLGVSVRKIAQTVLGSTAASISFTSIPATYESLMLILSGRSERASVSDAVTYRFNNDSAGNYDDETVANTTGTVVAGLETLGATFIYAGRIPAASATADKAGISKIIIPGYARTVFHKSLMSQNHYATSNGANTIFALIGGGTWRSTAAIDRIDILPGVGNLSIGTVATLYGIAG